MQKDNAPIYNLEIHEILERFKTTEDGLSAHEAGIRLKHYGPNELTSKKESWFKRLIEPFASVFVGVLLAASVLSIVEGQHVDAIIISIIVIVNAGIYYGQQYSVGRVLKTLKQQDVSYVHVLRSGQTVRVPSEELTYGDVVHVEEGMKVPADGRLIESNQIQADEALLTGESLPLHKQAAAIEGEHKLYDQRNMLFKGTYIKGGSGLMVVTGIGNKTELGAITDLAARTSMTRSPIERKIDSFTKKLIVVIMIIAAGALALALWRGLEFSEAIRFTLALIVSAVPETLPVALTVVLLLCARRMAKVKALVKKISSIETMGALTLIATDKTGTITQNKLSVADKHTTHGSPHVFDEVIRASLNVDGDHASDPLDKILLDSVEHVNVPASWEKVKDFAFNQAMRVSGTLWKHGNVYSLYIKGAPEHVLSHCGEHHRSDGKIKNMLDSFTSRGYRTIAFAHKDYSEPPHKLEAHVLADMSFDGFVGMADQLRPNITHAVAEAHHAGIKVVMLTGDHVNTAGYIAQQVGIARSDEQVRDSTILETGSEEDIRASLARTTVFGRVLPEHKHALLKATKDHEITAMTGDGVNDIPALVQADAGIAMGSGTDAAKDASEIVLLDNNFHTIVAAVREGRTALANIRKMLMFLMGTGAQVILLLLALILDMPLPMVAIMILWVNLMADGVSVIPLGLSPPEPNQMRVPPRHPDAAILNFRQVTRILTFCLVMSLTVLAIFSANLDKGLEYAQTLVFLGVIVSQWVNAFSLNFEYKSWVYNFIRPNWKLTIAIALSIAVQFVVFMTPFGQFLHVVPVAWKDALLAIALPAVAVLVALDLHKYVYYLISKRKRA